MTEPAALADSHGRLIEDLRVSVTDRCNFRCQYCMPAEGLAWMDRESILSFEEIERLVRLFTRLGVRDVRLTGGEPLVRRQFPELVARLAALGTIGDLSLTTNGYLLGRDAVALARRAAPTTRRTSADRLVDPGDRRGHRNAGRPRGAAIDRELQHHAVRARVRDAPDRLHRDQGPHRPDARGERVGAGHHRGRATRYLDQLQWPTKLCDRMNV